MKPSIKTKQIAVPGIARALAHAARDMGGRAIIVGGAVRDAMLGFEPKDLDLEVYGVAEASMGDLVRKAQSHAPGADFKVERSGRSFPVWKVFERSEGQGSAIDVALPRREILVGPGHTGFAVQLDPAMSFADAASRRDFTLNAMGVDPLTFEVLDPHGGMTDLERGILRHVSDHFREDPLRVLRGMQFVARFGLTAAPRTLEVCQELSPAHLSRERIFGEFEKLVLKGQQPGRGLKFLQEAGWLRFFPELQALVGVPQDPEHHPEGCAWTHTMHVMDAFARLRSGVDSDDRILGFAALTHDLGKATHTEFIEGRWRSYGHEEAGEKPTRSFLGRMTAETDFINQVVGLVVNHMRPKLAYKSVRDGHNADRAVRRLATKTRIDLLAKVIRADNGGRPPRAPDAPEADWLEATAARQNVSKVKPVPLVQGRHLIAAGLQPGPHFAPVLKAVFERQLDGEVQSPEQALSEALKLVHGGAPRIRTRL